MSSLADNLGVSTAGLLGIGVLLVIQLGLALYALIDLARREEVVSGKKWVWLVIILFLNLIGPVLYLVAGRNPPPALEEPPAAASVPAVSRQTRIRSAVDELYAGQAASLKDAGPAITLSSLSRSFGDTLALDGLTLTVPAGSVFGFLGPNGAGKSTTLGILTGLDRPTSGAARILGHDVATELTAVQPHIGYLPDVPAFYGWMTATQLLELAADLFHLREPVRSERIALVMELCGLAGVTTQVGGYSRGMRQRLGLAQALLNSPQVLLLDEPTSALDPIGRRDLLEIILALRGRATVFFSTHILADVERVCDRVAILDRGRLVTESSMERLRHRTGALRLILQLDSAEAAEAVAGVAASRPWCLQAAANGSDVEIRVTDLETAQRAMPEIVAQLGLPLRRLETAEPTLEEVFVDLVQEGRS